MKNFSAFALVSFAALSSSFGAYYLNENFSTYANGNLVGQNGWTQSGTATTNPLTITGGKLVMAGNTSDNQDALKAFSTPSSAAAGTKIYEGFQLQVTGKGNNNTGFTSSYFAALQDQAATPFFDVRTGFFNVDNASFQVATRVNGQGANPFSSSPTMLPFGSNLVSIVISITLASGSVPDTIQLWVNPASLSAPADVTITNAGATLAGGFQALLLSQFTNSSDVTISRLAVADSFSEVFSVVAVPEPSTLALMGLATVAAAWIVRKKRRHES